MIYKHYSEIVIPNDKKILIAGNGKSLIKKNSLNLSDFYVISLSASIDLFENVYLWVMMDTTSEDWKFSERRNKAQYVLTRSINYQDNDQDKVYYVQYRNDRNIKGEIINIFPNEKALPHSCSISGLALCLPTWGVKEVHTIGIDGGNDYCEGLDTKGQNTKQDYSINNEGFFMWNKTNNINVIKL